MKITQEVREYAARQGVAARPWPRRRACARRPRSSGAAAGSTGPPPPERMPRTSAMAGVLTGPSPRRGEGEGKGPRIARPMRSVRARPSPPPSPWEGEGVSGGSEMSSPAEAVSRASLRPRSPSCARASASRCAGPSPTSRWRRATPSATGRTASATATPTGPTRRRGAAHDPVRHGPHRLRLRRGLPGIHAMYAGTDFRWRAAAPRGRPADRRAASCSTWSSRPSRSRGAPIQQIYATTFHDDGGELVCEADSCCFRTERDTARERGKYGRVEPTATRPSEIARDRAEATATRRSRGAEPRYVGGRARRRRAARGRQGAATRRPPRSPSCWAGAASTCAPTASPSTSSTATRRSGIPNELGVPEPPERVHWDAPWPARSACPAPTTTVPSACPGSATW